MAEPGLVLHHYNAPAHTVLYVQRFWAAKNMVAVPYLPYLPDLAPCDFFLFPRMKPKLKACRFQDVTEIQRSQFQRCFQQWQKSWNRCINSELEYFEGDSNE
jgi:hypothetical protein